MDLLYIILICKTQNQIFDGISVIVDSQKDQ